MRKLGAVLCLFTLLITMPITAHSLMAAGGGRVDGGGWMVCECWLWGNHTVCVCLEVH